MFTRDPVTNQLEISDEFHEIKEFNTLKRIVKICANDQGMVDLAMMLSLVEQINQKMRMFSCNQMNGDIVDIRTDEQIQNDCFYEFLMVRPSKVEAALGGSSEGGGPEEKIDILTEKLEELRNEIREKL